jgi:hypothetical protein
LKFKDGKTIEQAADVVLSNYLIRCYAAVSKEYPPIAGMNPDDGVMQLFKLRNEGKIEITLQAVGDRIKCIIKAINYH